MKKYILRPLHMLSKRLMFGFLIQLSLCTVLLANTENAKRKTLEEVKISVNLSVKPLSQFSGWWSRRRILSLPIPISRWI